MVSITANFILYLLFELANKILNKCFKFRLIPNTIWYYVSFTIFTVALAYLIGRIINSQRFDKVLEWLKISHTVKPTFWDDIISTQAVAADIQLKSEPALLYHGEVKFVEEDASKPNIALCYYKVLDSQSNECIHDYTTDEQRLLVIHDDDIAKIEFIYHKDDPAR